MKLFITLKEPGIPVEVQTEFRILCWFYDVTHKKRQELKQETKREFQCMLINEKSLVCNTIQYEINGNLQTTPTSYNSWSPTCLTSTCPTSTFLHVLRVPSTDFFTPHLKL